MKANFATYMDNMDNDVKPEVDTNQDQVNAIQGTIHQNFAAFMNNMNSNDSEDEDAETQRYYSID